MIEVIDAKMFKKVLQGAYANLENNKQTVNNLNVFPVPDGDTGTNMSLTVKTAAEEVAKVVSDNIGDIAAALSSGSLMGARGNSGVILSQLFRGFAKELKDVDKIDINVLVVAFESATKMAYRAVMKPTEGTILTVAREMSEFASKHADSYSSVEEFILHVRDAGEKSLQNTPNLLPVLKEANVVDAGGRGLLCLFDGALSVLKGDEVVVINVESVEEESGESGSVASFEIASEDITFAFCTELLIRVSSENKKYEEALRAALQDKLKAIGDSLVVVGDSGIIKVHVHTNAPWNALKMAATCGDLIKIKIENMREQHNEILLNESKEEKYSKEEKDFVFIGVAAGDGMSAILKDLGMDYVIEGGQTMNPSTQDFLDIIENTNGKNYILMPNNKNIIMAATQAMDISEKNIDVVKTRTIPECIGALMVFEPDNSLKDNVSDMAQAIEDIKTGQVTFAVRDTMIGDKKINKDDILGIFGSDIVATSKEISDATISLIENMVDDDSELISIYYGQDMKEEDADKLGEIVEEKYPDLDVEITYGGQPLYYYIVSVE